MTNITFLLYNAILPIVMDSVELYNTSFAITVKHHLLENGELSVSLGQDDIFLGTSINHNSLFPCGSITKMVTTIKTLKMYEEGLLDIDKPVFDIVNPLIESENGTTLEEIFGDESVRLITPRQIIGMRSGIGDYDDQKLRMWGYENPELDRTPYDLLYDARDHDGGLHCKPDTCGFYSTVGFNLMGLVIAAVEKKKSWKDLDLSKFLPEADWTKSMLYGGEGPCTQYSDDDMVRQYGFTYDESVKGVKLHFFDISSCSCLNSWTGGSLAATTSSLANLAYYTYTGQLLSEKSTKMLTNFTKLDSTDSAFTYGLGTMAIDIHNFTFPNQSAPWFSYGHLGADYGSAGMSLYTPKWDFSIGVGTNSESGMNCTGVNTSNVMLQEFSFIVTYCRVLQASIKVLGGEVFEDLCDNLFPENLGSLRKLVDFGRKSRKIECEWDTEIPV